MGVNRAVNLDADQMPTKLELAPPVPHETFRRL